MNTDSKNITLEKEGSEIKTTAMMPIINHLNIDDLRLSQNFSEANSVKKAILTVPVRKPNGQDFFRVRPGDEWSLQTAILEHKDDHISYLVNQDLWAELSREIIPKIIFTTINRQGVLSLWPVRLPGSDGRQDHWSRSALDAAELAKKRWIRMASNMSLGAYEVFTALSELADPEWPDLSFNEMLNIAFRDQYIDSIDHHVLRKLRGME